MTDAFTNPAYRRQRMIHFWCIDAMRYYAEGDIQSARMCIRQARAVRA